MSAEHEVDAKPTGVSDVLWNNITQEWNMYCLCDAFVTMGSRHLTDEADEMEDHWRDDHGWTP